MSRFRTLLRLTLQLVMLTSTSGCSVTLDPIYCPDGGCADPLSSRILYADGEGIISFTTLDDAPPYRSAVRWRGVSGIAAQSDVLFAFAPRRDGLAMFDSLAAIDPGRGPTRVLTPEEHGGAMPGRGARMWVDDNGTLWMVAQAEREIRAFIRATERLPDGNFSAAIFSDGPLDAAAYDETRDRLYAGATDRASLLVWVDALTRESVGASTFTLSSDCGPSAIAFVAGRLFAACASGSGAPKLFVYDQPELATGETAPDVVLPIGGNALDMASANGALFVLTAAGVEVFSDAAGVAAGPADVTVLETGTRIEVDAQHTLFVMNASEVRVVANVTSTAEVLGAVRTERAPLDLAIE